jgi:hypothetical protein
MWIQSQKVKRVSNQPESPVGPLPEAVVRRVWITTRVQICTHVIKECLWEMKMTVAIGISDRLQIGDAIKF